MDVPWKLVGWIAIARDSSEAERADEQFEIVGSGRYASSTVVSRPMLEVHIYVSDNAYSVDFLSNESLDYSHSLYYVGTLGCRKH